jgi:hypothetical protein
MRWAGTTLQRMKLRASWSEGAICGSLHSLWSVLQKQTPWPESVSEPYRPRDCRLSAKLVPKFPVTGCHVVSVTDPYGRILGFLGRSRYFFFHAAPQLYSRGWVDPVPDSLLLRKSGSVGNRTRTSGSIARNSNHQTTEAVNFLLHNIYKFSSYLTGNTIYLRSAARNSDHQTTERSAVILWACADTINGQI